MKFHVRTYGCQMNERDSEAVSALLSQHGFAEAESEDQADIIIVNTCSVRGKAEEKALGKLRLLVSSKRERPGRIIGAIGCVVQQLKHDILRQAPGLDFAIGTHKIAILPGILASVIEGNGPLINTDEENDASEALSLHTGGKISAFVNILYGCNRRCSYCVVPKVRGEEWSRAANKVLDEIRSLADGGVREVTLLGQSVMSYGRGNEVWPKAHVSPRGYAEPLSRLLEAVNGVDGIKRIRFTSGHPSGCTAELARVMAELPAVCGHMHIPLQSGSDRILDMMRRGYSTDDYRLAVKRLRSAVPDIALTTDIIVGFPSETVEDFEMTRRFMDEIGFDNAFIFKYSPRPETAAAKWRDDVAPEVKLERNKVLLADQDKRGLAGNSRLIGRTVEILIEGVSLRNKSRWSGRTPSNKIVVFAPKDGAKVGDLANVRLERATAQTLYGTMISEKEV